MQQLTIKCDECGLDMSDNGPMPGYMVKVRSEKIRQSGGICYAVAVYPSTKDKDFCGYTCMKKHMDSGHWNRRADIKPEEKVNG